MPVGNLPGWKQIFSEDFTTPLPLGSFPGPYASKWQSYDGFPDTFGVARYDQRIISVHDGALDVYLHTKNGQPLSAAPVPLVNGKWGGQVYGRYSVRMKADSMESFKPAFLLWPDTDNWKDGEIDFPEGPFDSSPYAVNHLVGSPSANAYLAKSKVAYTDWHTYTINWTPDRLSFYIDGELLGSTTSSIPTKAMHWVLQMESDGDIPAPSTAGHVLIDWATIYSYVP
ncbi:MAG: glycoside hydrolase family 16 protein [Nakamurella sp.]